MENFISKDEQKVTSSIDDILASGDHTGRPFNVLIGSNMGNRTLIFSVPLATFYDISEVGNRANLAAIGSESETPITQRKLDEAHAKRLARFLLKGLIDVVYKRFEKEGSPIPEALAAIRRELGTQPYISMQPITTNIRTCKFGGDGLEYRKEGGAITVFLSDKHVLWVIDGQHRRHAMHLVFEFLKAVVNNQKYPRKPVLYEPSDDPKREPTQDETAIWSEAFQVARTDCSIAVETHLGLDFDQERQLFHDLNNLAKTVDGGLVYEFDNSNPINRFVKETLIDKGILKASLVESEGKSDWKADSGTILRKDLIAVNALLFLNKTTIRGASPGHVSAKEDYAIRFWEAVNQIPGWGEPGAKQNTVAAQPVVLKALAKLYYDFTHGREANPKYSSLILESIEEGDIDFSHRNKLWRYFELPPEIRAKAFEGLERAVAPEDSTANIDLGSFDEANQVMRFGAKHNDILRHLGDLIRWRLGLPMRPALVKQWKEVEMSLLVDELDLNIEL